MFIAKRIIQVMPGKKREFIDTWHNAVGSRLKRQPGFVSAFLLISPQDDEVIVMSMWRSERYLLNWRKSEMYREVHSHIGGLTRQRLSEKHYEIAAQVDPLRQ